MRWIAAFAALVFGVIAVGCGGSPTSAPVIPGFDVRGTVRSPSEPVEGARVDAFGNFGGSSTTDGQGRYLLPRLSGSLTLSAWKPGYYTEWAFINARDGAADFRLQPAETIETGQTVTGIIGGGNSRGPWCGGNDLYTCVVLRWTPVVTGSVEMSVTWNQPVVVFGSVLTSTEELGTTDANPPGSASMLVPVKAGTVYEVRVSGSGPTEIAVTLTQR